MRHDVRRKRWIAGSVRAIASGLPGNPAFSLGLIMLTIWFFLLFCGCSGEGRTVILRPSEPNVRYSSVLVTQDGSDPFVPPEVSRYFRTTLETYLYDRNSFVHGPGLRIVYRITAYPSAGEMVSSEGKKESGMGPVTAEVTFYNFVEKEIASVRAEGDIRDVDRIDKAVKECARQVALYVNRNFQ
jgi:hypothetical protein